MLKSILIICILTLSNAVLADDHSNNSNIEYKTSFWGTKYYLTDAPKKRLSRNALKKLVRTDPDALAEFRKSNTPFIVSTGFATIGGFMIGSALGTAVGKDESVDTGVIAGGIVFATIGILFDRNTQKHLRSSVDLYNASRLSLQQKIPTLKRVKSQLFLTSNKVGVTLRF